MKFTKNYSLFHKNLHIKFNQIGDIYMCPFTFQKIGPKVTQPYPTTQPHLNLAWSDISYGCNFQFSFTWYFYHPIVCTVRTAGSSWAPSSSARRWRWSWSTASPWGCTSPARTPPSATPSARSSRWCLLLETIYWKVEPRHWGHFIQSKQHLNNIKFHGIPSSVMFFSTPPHFLPFSAPIFSQWSSFWKPYCKYDWACLTKTPTLGGGAKSVLRVHPLWMPETANKW